MQTSKQKKHAEYMREWRQNHPGYQEKQRITFKQFAEKHPGYFYEYNKKWRENHPNKVSKMSKQYKKRHPEIRAKQRKTYRQNHPEKVGCRTKSLSYPMDEKCNNCRSDKDLQRHHPDYSKPEQFFTLCRKCHKKVHNET